MVISICSGRLNIRLHASTLLSMSGLFYLKSPIPLVLSVSKYERTSISNRYKLLSTFNFQLFYYLFPCHPLNLNDLISAVPSDDYGNKALGNIQPVRK
jgi:hypothetical protein